jgi:hypothetical protein
MEAVGIRFIQVPGAVQGGAQFSGDDYMSAAAYLNTDGANGNGELTD